METHKQFKKNLTAQELPPMQTSPAGNIPGRRGLLLPFFCFPVQLSVSYLFKIFCIFAPMKRIANIVGALLPYLLFILLLPLSVVAWVAKGFSVIIRRTFPTQNEGGK